MEQSSQRLAPRMYLAGDGLTIEGSGASGRRLPWRCDEQHEERGGSSGSSGSRQEAIVVGGTDCCRGWSRVTVPRAWLQDPERASLGLDVGEKRVKGRGLVARHGGVGEHATTALVLLLTRPPLPVHAQRDATPPHPRPASSRSVIATMTSS